MTVTVIATTKAATPFSTNQVLTYPAGAQAGDWFAAILAVDGGPSPGTFINAWPTGWIELATRERPDTIVVSTAVAVKPALGTETGTFTVTLSQAQPGSWIIALLRGASSVTPSVATIATGGNISPDPNNRDMGVSKAYFAMAAFGCNFIRTVSAYPFGMTQYNQAQAAAENGGASTGFAGQNFVGTAFNPNAFTISANASWHAYTFIFTSGTTSAVGLAEGTSTAQAFHGKTKGLATGSCSVWGFASVPQPAVGIANGVATARGWAFAPVQGAGLAEGSAEAEADGRAYRLFWFPEDGLPDVIIPATPDTDIWIPEDPF